VPCYGEYGEDHTLRFPGEGKSGHAGMDTKATNSGQQLRDFDRGRSSQLLVIHALVMVDRTLVNVSGAGALLFLIRVKRSISMPYIAWIIRDNTVRFSGNLQATPIH
jgi:hypothetical protein